MARFYSLVESDQATTRHKRQPPPERAAVADSYPAARAVLNWPALVLTIALPSTPLVQLPTTRPSGPIGVRGVWAMVVPCGGNQHEHERVVRAGYRRVVARPPRWQATLDAATGEACLAVRLYNDAAETRAFEGLVIHMHLAWLYLLHAEFVRDGIDFRYWDSRYKRRLVRVDGEAKRWELQRSTEERWPDERDPVRANLSLFIRLRNRLEHRHAPRRRGSYVEPVRGRSRAPDQLRR
jgi:hypothetical protein